MSPALHLRLRDFPVTGVACIAIAATVWLSYFFFSSELGLYQDDVFMYHIVRNAHPGILSEAFDFSRGYGGEGRYGNQVILVLVTALGAQLDDVTGLYIVCWVLLSTYGAVAYLFFRQLFPVHVSFVSAAFFILFPADAAKFFAVSYMALISGILFLIACILAMRRHLFWSVAALAITLSIGEAYLPMAFLIPVVVLAYNPAAWRTAIKFLLLYGLMSLAYVAARLTFAPGRASGVADADKLELAGRILQAMYYGVSASLSSFGKRIGEFLGEANSGSLTIAFTVFVVLGCAFAFLSSGTTIRTQTQGAHGEAKPNAHARFYFAAFALLACAAAYPLYGMYPARFPPTIIDGKLSNIHGTAALGFSGLLASALSLIEARRQRARWLFVSLCVLVMAYESCLAGYFAVVQQRYAESWRYQLAFFRHLPEVAPTLHARSLVVVEPMGAEATRLEGGSPFDWTLPYLAQFVWRVPRSWPDTPLVINNYFFTTTSRVRGEFIDIVGYPTLPARTFLQRDIIRVRVKDGRLFSSERDKTYARDIGVPFWDEPQTTGVFRPGEFQLRAVRRRQEAQGLVTLVPNNYTGAGWHNGVMKVPGPNNDMFYFIVDDETLNPIHAGDTVQFATAGKASVSRVDLAKQDGRVSVFVQVNRDLDPNRDGFPNRVTVLSEPER